MRRQQHHEQCFDGLASVEDVKKCIKRGHYVLVLMRGAPGSGKTHLAEELKAYRLKKVDAEDIRQPAIFSTDRFFYTPNGRYAFDNSRLDEFHKKNLAEAKEAIEGSLTPVVVDNTNMQLAHLRPYIQHAIKHSYEIYVVEPATAWSRDARQLAKKNKHFVDERKIELMLASYEPIHKFSEFFKPLAFVINRPADFSDFESDGEEGGEKKAQLQPLQPLQQSLLSLGLNSHHSDSSHSQFSPLNSIFTSSLPPGLPSPLPHLMSPTTAQHFSMKHETVVRDVGCQATVAMGLLVESGEKEPAEMAALSFTEGASRSSQRRVASSSHSSTDPACPAPNPVTVIATAFTTVPLADVQLYAAEHPLGEYTKMLRMAGFPMNYAAPIPWTIEDADRSNRPKKGRHKQEIACNFSTDPSTTPKSTPRKMKNTNTHSASTQRGGGSGWGEGCGATSEDPASASASLSNGSYQEEKMEPLAAAFLDDDESISIDVNQPIKNLLELFFGHNCVSADVHLPMWLLHLLHRSAKGERLTKASIYHEEFPSIDLHVLQDDQVAEQQQLRDDAAIARQLHAEEAAKAATTAIEGFTPHQMDCVRKLRTSYPLADADSLAQIFKSMGFDLAETLTVLGEQFGEAAPEMGRAPPPLDAFELPAAIKAPPPVQQMTRVVPSAQAQPQYNQRAAASSSQNGRSLPTVRSDGWITDVGLMAQRNGAKMTQDEVRRKFMELHELRQEKQRILDDFVKKATAATSNHTRGYYGQEARKAKAARIEVQEEIRELAQWWNENLNSDVIDLHFMLADQAMEMLRERIKDIQKRGGKGAKKLTVIYGSGNNSLGGIPEIKKRVTAMITSNKWKSISNNTGAVIICF